MTRPTPTGPMVPRSPTLPRAESRRPVTLGLSLFLLAAACNGAVIDDGKSGDETSDKTGGSSSGSPGGGSGAMGEPGTGSGPGAGTPGGPSTSGPGSSARQCTGTPAIPEARLWRLTHRQLKNTLVDAFGFSVPSVETLPAESRLDGFANASERLGISSALFDYYGRTADDVATEALKRSGDLLKCPVAALGTGTCLDEFIDAVAAKAWRRPISDDERGKLKKLYTTAAGDVGPEEGFKTLVTGLVLSANFLFRTELGADPGAATTKLTDLELASSLSYMLWDGPPDAELMDLAQQGALHQPEALAKQARRLYETARAPEALFSFVQQWLEIDDFKDKPKDMLTFPTFTAEVAQDLEDETRMFVKGVFFDPTGDKSFSTLLTAPYGYLSTRTAKLYGVDGAAGTTLAKADLDPTQRRGILTQATFLADHAEPINTSVVARGRFVREEVLCADVPPPPAEFKFNEKVITEDMTAREKFTEHSKNPACKACHSLFDGIGFALENYDAVGHWRTTEKGKMIDPTGALDLPSGGKLEFKSFVDMIDQLGKGTDAYDCFAAQFLQYVSGRVKLDDCERANAARAFAESGYKLDALVMAIVTSPSFSTRSN